MIIARLTASYDRSMLFNDKKLLADGKKARVLGPGEKTSDGKVIRGLGTHFKNEKAYEDMKARDSEFARVRRAFRMRFLVTPLDGVYIVPERGVAKRFIDSLGVRKDVEIRVTEFQLTSFGGNSMDTHELEEWCERVKKQFKDVSLGRGDDADDEGLRCLEYLASCPAISKSTGHRIKSLVAMVRAKKLDRVELKRKIATLDVQVDAEALAPRRAPVFETPELVAA